MSGHSKWSKIKHQKGADDIKRGNLFTKLTREIIMSAREGGGSLVEMKLEGYGPNGIAILVNALSDNRNRTVQEVRSTFTRHGGSLGESGSVSWLFENKGVISIDAANVDADEL